MSKPLALQRPHHHRSAAGTAALLLGVGTALFLTIAGTPARADVKVVAEAAMTGRPPAPPGTPSLPLPAGPQTTTTYYKGDWVRSEGNGVITLFEGSTGKTIALNPAKKTYTVNATQKMLERMRPFLAMMKMDIGGGVKEGGATRDVQGYPAENYLLDMTISMSLNNGTAPAAGGAPAAPIMTVKIQGEQWTTEKIRFPAANAQQILSSAMTRMLGPLLQQGKQFGEKMGAVKGFPLSSKITITFTSAMALPGLPKDPMVITTEVRSVSEAPLDDALFTIPEGYKEVEPQAPGLPGGTPSRS